jgi:hypothetical protein
MSALHPTKTRLALLAAIKAREVTGYPTYDSGYVEYFWDDEPGHSVRVTKRVEELLAVEPAWVGKGAARDGSSPTSDFKPELTEAGWKVLEVAGDA